MRKLVVTSCGLSLLSNSAREREIVEPFPWDMANLSEQDLPPAARQRADQIVDTARGCLAGATVNAMKRLSAELNVLFRLYDHDLAAARGDMHFLLSSDTYFGRRAAELHEERLRSEGVVASTQVLQGLTMGNAFDPKFGIDHLIRWAADTVPDYRDRGYRVIFNVVGGFKVLQAYLNVLGMLWADELVYIFETGKELIRIPRLPLKLEPERVIGTHAQVLRRLDLGLEVDAELLADVPEALYYRLGSHVELSPWGAIVWREHTHDLYREALLNSPSERAVFGPGFASSVEEFAGTPHMWDINQRIDDLCRFINTGKNPARLSFKKLQGRPRANSTHEFYAWSSGNASRVFCHYDDDGRIVIDELGRHLG